MSRPHGKACSERRDLGLHEVVGVYEKSVATALEKDVAIGRIFLKVVLHIARFSRHPHVVDDLAEIINQLFAIALEYQPQTSRLERLAPFADIGDFLARQRKDRRAALCGDPASRRS